MGANESCTVPTNLNSVNNADPPTRPEDTQEAYRTLVKSGEHYRKDILCLMKKEQQMESAGLWKRMFGEAKPSQCSEYDSNSLSLQHLYGQDMDAAYTEYLEKLELKHSKETRHLLDKYTASLPIVAAKFKRNMSEPINAALEKTLYTCLRKNVHRPLNCWDECQCYIANVKRNASLCFRMGPASVQKQSICKIKIEPYRKLPVDEDDDVMPELAPITAEGGDITE